MKIKSCVSVFISCFLTAATVYAANSSMFQIRLATPAVPGAAPPADSDQMKLFQHDRASGRTKVEMLYVQRTVLLDKNDLKTTSVVTSSSTGQLVIAITFTEQGRRRFAEVTRQNIDHQLAIIIDGRVYSAPLIRDKISGGQAEITGDFTRNEAEDLSRRINETLQP